MQHAVDDDLAVFDLEIKAPVLRAEAVQGAAVALDLAEALAVEVLQVALGHLELVEQLELFEGIEPGNLGRADFVEDDLEHGGSLEAWPAKSKSEFPAPAAAGNRLVSKAATFSLRTMKPILALLAFSLASAAAAEPAPLKVMLITGGCCHDYATQTKLLKKGLEERIHVRVDQIHVDDKSTAPPLPIHGNPDYAAGYDLVIHDQCAADIKDPAVIRDVLKPHLDGLPAVALHCAMHSYRSGDFRKKVETTGGDGSLWFEFLGLQSSGHGRQEPIAITFTDKTHPATRGAKDWTTIQEELYNVVRLFDSARPLATGTQGKAEAVVVWTNQYGPAKTRVFCTTLGHNNDTVKDARYLDLVAKGLLWAADKLDDKGRPQAGYGRPKP